jgi:hypothetical protein
VGIFGAGWCGAEGAATLQEQDVAHRIIGGVVIGLEGGGLGGHGVNPRGGVKLPS